MSNFSIFHEHNRDRRGAGGRGFYAGLVTGAKRLPLDPRFGRPWKTTCT